MVLLACPAPLPPAPQYYDGTGWVGGGIFVGCNSTTTFHCKSGPAAGATCLGASVDCFGSCPSMGNWAAAQGYQPTFASFQAFCASWNANGGTFNGGAGPCP